MLTRSRDAMCSETPNKSMQSNPWSEKEKRLLLNAVKIYGVSNIEEISKMIPNRDKQVIHDYIKRQIRRYKHYKLINIVHLNNGPVKCLRMAKDVEKSPIDHWLDILRKTSMFPLKHFNALSFFMKLLSDFGEHAPLESEDDVDFKSLYLFTSQLLEGMKPGRVNKKTQEYARRTLEELAVQHRDSSKFTEEMNFLKNMKHTFFTRPKPNNTLPINSLLEALDDIHTSKILNPFNIPPELMKKKED